MQRSRRECLGSYNIYNIVFLGIIIIMLRIITFLFLKSGYFLCIDYDNSYFKRGLSIVILYMR